MTAKTRDTDGERPAGDARRPEARPARAPAEEGGDAFASRKLALFNRIGNAVLDGVPIRTLLEAAAAGVCEFLDVPRCAVRLLGEPPETVEHRRPGYPSVGALLHTDGCPNRPGDKYASGCNLVVADLRECPCWETIREQAEAARLAAFLGVPMRAGGELIGVLFLDDARPRAWTAREIGAAEAVARQVAVAVQHARLFRSREELAGQLMSLMNNVPGVVYRCTPDGAFTLVGSNVHDLTGHPPEAFLSGAIAWRDLVPTEDREALDRALQDTLAAGEGAPRMEYRIRHRDGGLRWIADRRQLIRGAGGEVIRVEGLLLDISDRKNDENALRHQLQFMQVLIDALPNPVFYKDDRGIYLGCNTAFARFLGLSREEIVGRSVHDIAPKPLADTYRKADDDLLRAGGPQTYEESVRPANGPLRRVIFNKATFPGPDGTPGGIVGTFSDITELKEREGELREVNARLKGLIQASPLPILSLDFEGLVLLWNPAAERVFGWKEEEVVGKALPTLPEDRKEEARKLREMVSMGMSLSGVETRRMRRDGTTIDVSISAAPLHDASGKVGAIISVIADITGRKQMEEALHESQERLRQSQKMDAIGRLAGGVAHDFNNLLTAIHGYSELVLLRMGTESPMRRDVEEIMRASDRAASLTQQLLAFSRKQVLQPRVLELNAVVADMDKLLRRLIGEDVDLVSVPAPGLRKVKVDRGQIEQVILNLVVNARDAMPRGGTIVVETANVELAEGGDSSSGEGRCGPHVLLTVRDNGCGMDRATLSRLFEPFFTTKEKGKGTGLGLSTVYGIVRQSGGEIRVDSAPGEGTTFRVYFPAHEDEEIALPGTEETGRPARGRETILLVEDDDVVRSLAAEVLRGSGYTVLVARNGEEALALAMAQPAPIHLVITDVIMPRKGGGELVEELSARLPGLRALYMSGYTDEAVFRHGLPGEGIPFLQKPFSLDALLRRVRSLLDEVPAAS